MFRWRSFPAFAGFAAIALAGGLLCGRRSPSARDAPPTARVLFVPDKVIHIDARLSEPVWTHAARLTLCDFWNQKSHPPESTEVLLLDTGRSLVVAFLCEDRYIRADPTRQHDGDTYADDCVELFFARPEDDIGEGIGLEINARGVLTDLRVWNPEKLDFTWEAGPKVRIATKRVDSLRPWSKVATGAGWIAEVEIPWRFLRRELAMPGEIGRRPESVRANFGRWNHAERGWGIFTLWSDSRLPVPKPHTPAQYGWLKLQPAADSGR
ncbi:hypothetical protein OPIT5_10255 [Opitutaceae bacterium TAV5]|nr:hypothetical protein OPIT5_10255 [Opitutaceae bacterium TAV5]